MYTPNLVYRNTIILYLFQKIMSDSDSISDATEDDTDDFGDYEDQGSSSTRRVLWARKDSYGYTIGMYFRML